MNGNHCKREDGGKNVRVYDILARACSRRMNIFVLHLKSVFFI